MTVQLLVNVLIGLAIVALLIVRQLRWRTFEPARALRLPIVLAVVGVLQLADVGSQRFTAPDAALIGVELAVSIGVGAALGRRTVFRQDPTDPQALQSQTGAAGAALWLVLVALRVAIDAIGTALGAHVLTATGTILLLLAVTRATSALVARARAPRATAAGMISA